MPVDQQRRLAQAAAAAHAAIDRGDHHAANEAWRRYVLIEDALRDPQDLLDEGVALSKVAIDLWTQRGGDFDRVRQPLDDAQAPDCR